MTKFVLTQQTAQVTELLVEGRVVGCDLLNVHLIRVTKAQDGELVHEIAKLNAYDAAVSLKAFRRDLEAGGAVFELHPRRAPPPG